jgi:hypothetical protein
MTITHTYGRAEAAKAGPDDGVKGKVSKQKTKVFRIFCSEGAGSTAAFRFIFGLSFATVLTLIVVPVLYLTFYRVNAPPRLPAGERGGSPGRAPQRISR